MMRATTYGGLSTRDSALPRRSTTVSARGGARKPLATAGKSKPKPTRVKLRAREHARLQCQNLELDVLNLRQEIATLSSLRSVLYARTLQRAAAPHVGSFEKTIREFYALSHAGYFDVVWRKHATTAMTATSQRRRPEPVDMVQFMRASFDASMAFGSQAPPTDDGLERFLAVMRQMVVVLDSSNVSLLHAEVRTTERSTEATVAVKTRCASWLTAQLLDAMFPHLSDACPWLRTKLIGRQVVTIGEGDFTFDAMSGRVVRVDLRLDQNASILKLAESMEELRLLKGEPSGPEIVEYVETEAGDESETDNQRDAVRCRNHTDHARRSSGSLSSMSLQHVLSPDDDDEEGRQQQ